METKILLGISGAALAVIILLVFAFAGCSETIKYQCVDGSFTDEPQMCAPPPQMPFAPEVRVEERIVEKEIIKYQCANGSVQDTIEACTINITQNTGNSTNTTGEYQHMFDEYRDYARFVRPELQNKTGLQFITRNYEGEEGIEHTKINGSVYFVMYSAQKDKITDFFAVQADSATGAILRYENVTYGYHELDRRALWWR